MCVETVATTGAQGLWTRFDITLGRVTAAEIKENYTDQHLAQRYVTIFHVKIHAKNDIDLVRRTQPVKAFSDIPV